MTTANGSPMRNGYSQLSSSAQKALVNIGQTGSPFDPMSSRLFLDYQTGGVFSATSDWDARRVRSMLASDGTSKSLEQVLSLPIRSAEVTIQPAKGDNGEAAFCRDVLGDQLDDLVDQMTSAIAYKQSFHEKCWSLNDGKLVIDELAWRPPQTCDPAWNRDGTPNGFRQRVSWAMDPAAQSNTNKTPGWVQIPRERAFVYVHGRHREPLTGVSDLDVVWSSWETRQKLMFLWFQFLEGQSLPKTVAYGSGDDDAQNNAEAFASGKASAVIPMTYPPDPAAKTFEVVESSGQGAGQFIEALRYLESKAVNSVLAGFTELATAANNGQGSYALSSSQSEFFLKSRQAVADEIGSTIRRELLTQLVVLNFGADAAVPTVSIGPLSDLEQERALNLLSTLLVSPVIQAPRGVVEQLLMMTSQFVGIDADKLHDELEKTRGTDDAYVSVAQARTTENQTTTTRNDGSSDSSPSSGSGGAPSSQLTLPGMPSGAPAGADSEQTQLSNAIALSHELTTRALAGEDPTDVLSAIRERLELARHVRTEAGAKRYKLPIGSPIGGADEVAKAAKVIERTNKSVEHATAKTGKARAAAKTAGRSASKTTSASPSDPAARLKASTLTGPDGIGKRQTSAAKYAVTNGKQTFVAGDGSPSFDAPHGEGYTRFDPDGTAWKSENGEQPHKVPQDKLDELFGTYLDDGSAPKQASPSAVAPAKPKVSKPKAQEPKAASKPTTTPKPAPEAPKTTTSPPTASTDLGPVVPSSTIAAKLVRETKQVKFSKAEAQAVYDYRTGTYGEMNSALRAGRYTDGYRTSAAEIRAANEAMQSAISKYRLPASVTVTRGVSSSKWLPRGKDLTGSTVVNQGFVSTAMGSDADFFASGGVSPMMLNITVPKGFTALPIDGVRGAQGRESSAENELVLPHGTQFKVTKDTTTVVNGRKVRSLHVTAVPPAAGTTVAGKAKLG